MEMYRRKHYLNPPRKRWSERELMDLATGIQKYGTADLQKVSLLIKTKSEADVRKYIKRRLRQLSAQKYAKLVKIEEELGRKTSVKKLRKRLTSWNVKDVGDTRNWRTVRKWKKIIENQMPKENAEQDYSHIVIKNLCQKFYEEAKECTNPQVLDVKSIYKFMSECVSGQMPSQLGIKESAFVVALLKDMERMFQQYDFEEEFEFIRDFKKAPTYVPDEGKGATYEPGTYPVPEDLFKKLMRHRQVVYSFNPLGVPLRMLEKEQKYIKEFFKINEHEDQRLTSGEQNKE